MPILSGQYSFATSYSAISGIETSTEHGNKRKGRLPDADGRNLLFAAYFDNAVGDAFGLHLYDFAPSSAASLK